MPSERLSARFPARVIEVIAAALQVPVVPGETPQFEAMQAVDMILAVVPYIVAEVYDHASEDAWEAFSLALGDSVDRMWDICDATNPRQALEEAQARGTRQRQAVM